MALTYGTLRAHMARQLWLASQGVGAQLHGTSDQYAELVAGRAVTLTRAQLDMIGSHLSKDVVDLDLADEWVLGTDDQLTPAP